MRISVVLVGLAGLALAASQALAAGAPSATVRVGDRVGARSGPADQFFAQIPIGLVIMGSVVAGGVVIAGSDASGGSDSPASP